MSNPLHISELKAMVVQQYLDSAASVRVLASKCAISQSMSCVGHCIDNGLTKNL